MCSAPQDSLVMPSLQKSVGISCRFRPGGEIPKAYIVKGEEIRFITELSVSDLGSSRVLSSTFISFSLIQQHNFRKNDIYFIRLRGEEKGDFRSGRF